MVISFLGWIIVANYATTSRSTPTISVAPAGGGKASRDIPIKCGSQEHYHFVYGRTQRPYTQRIGRDGRQMVAKNATTFRRDHFAPAPTRAM